MRGVQVAEAVLMEELCVPACASEPRSDGRLMIPEDPFGCGSVQSFGECRQHNCNLMRGGFQSVQRGVASGSEGGAAGLAAKGLDLLGTAVLAIPNQSVALGIGDPAIRALLVGTGKALGVHPLGCSLAAFELAPRAYGSRPYTQRGSGGETAGGAIVWAAGLGETVERAALGPSS